jgi:hypothetical protein
MLAVVERQRAFDAVKRLFFSCSWVRRGSERTAVVLRKMFANREELLGSSDTSQGLCAQGREASTAFSAYANLEIFIHLRCAEVVHGIMSP